MEEKIFELLTQLAAQFGTTVEHLWSVMLRQATITGYMSLLWVFVIVVAFVIWFRVVRRKTTKTLHDDGYIYADWQDAAAYFAWGVSIILGVLVFAIVVDFLPQAITALLNPEYWALQHLRLR